MTRALSFGSVADTYDRLRPSPPIAAVAWLLPAAVELAVDLGAGTGRMTRRLLDRAGDVVAVDPDTRMLRVLKERSPQVHAVAGRGDAVPLRAASVDAVIVASAWHWMDQHVTVDEIARVLRPGGVFGVTWNGRDTETPWVRDLYRGLVADAEQHERERRVRALELPTGAPFTLVDAYETRFTQAMSVDDIAESMGTYSAVIALGPQRAAEAVERARHSLVEQFGAGAVIDMPFRSRSFRCRRL